jgi:hypothetical protein
VVAACLITGGTVFGVLVVTTWGEYRYSNTYYYMPGAPLPVEPLIITSDVGSINIHYSTDPSADYVKIDLDIRVVGLFVKGKTFSDLFYPIKWLNETTPVEFDLDNKYVFGVSYNITIDITLRSDVIYDINALTSTGSIDMNVLDNTILNNTVLRTSTGSIRVYTLDNASIQGNFQIKTSTGSIALYATKSNFTHGLTSLTSTGSLYLNFTECTIEDDLVGTVSTGSITIRSYNVKYTKDAVWNFETSTGSIDTIIHQFIDIGADITGSMVTSTGSINLYYRDKLTSVGAKFTGSTSTGSVSFTPIGIGGFTETGSSTYATFTSNSYNTAISTYTFDLTTSTGSVAVTGESAYL